MDFYILLSNQEQCSLEHLTVCQCARPSNKAQDPVAEHNPADLTIKITASLEIQITRLDI